LMKEQGVIITGDDIAQVSPPKERKDSSESDEDLPTSEDKVTTSAEGAFDAHVSKGKEPVVSDTAVGTAAATLKRKRSDKEKFEKVVEEKKKKVATSVSVKEKVTKKPRTQKKRAPKVVRKMVVQEVDEEETDEEPLQCKRKRSI
ncbi:hypothetical protein A2U01_0041650, partial [Trifolium medium]|nr:hypothetical protein [Trifolium medium]